MFSLAKSLESGVVCQRRTGSNKQFVILSDDKIIKGPYKPERLESLILKTRYLYLWEATYPKGIAVIPQEILETVEGKFVVFPNLAMGYPVEVEKERNQESFSSYPPYQVLIRNGLLKGNHALESGSTAIYDNAYSLLLTYLYLFLLNAGDVHFVNTLVDVHKNKVYVIDFDEDRGSLISLPLSDNGKDELFYLSLNPAKKYREQWLSVVRPLYPKVLAKLEELDKKYFTGGMIEKLEYVKSNLISPDVSIHSLVSQGSRGLMKYSGGMKGSLSYSGKPIDILISGVQKYIRRGMLEKALLCAFELFRMSEIDKDASRIVTNLWNRLEVIAAEDLLYPELLFAILKNEERNPGMLYTIIEQLVAAPKTRIMSWAWRAYCTPEGRDYFCKLGGKLDVALRESDYYILSADRMNIPMLGNNWMYLAIFLARLREKDLNCFAWLYYYLEATKNLKIEKRQSHGLGKGKRDSPMTLFWEMMGTSCGPTPGNLLSPQLADWLAKSYFEASDFNKKPFLSVAVMIAFYQIGRGEMVKLIPNNGNILKLLTGNYPPWEVDDFVVDKHTQSGKMMGKDRKTFALEGSLVANQDPRYYNEFLYQVYRNS